MDKWHLSPGVLKRIRAAKGNKNTEISFLEGFCHISPLKLQLESNVNEMIDAKT